MIAATVIALACGTNYVYSAWAPQFAAKLGLSSTEINLIGTFGNLGMYASGVPIGMLVDSRGPRPAAILGALALGLGYYPLHKVFDKGPGTMGVPLLCFFSTLTGLGSCSAFSAAIKTSAVNWPAHRGTATAFPIAGFGLSAFFFSGISSLAFPENTSGFLLLLAIGTFSMVAVSFFFLRIVSHPQPYTALPPEEDSLDIEPSEARRAKLGERGLSVRSQSYQPSRGIVSGGPIRRDSCGPSRGASHALLPVKLGTSKKNDLDETSSLMSDSPRSNKTYSVDLGPEERKRHLVHHVDIRGLALLPKLEFWQLFSLLGVLTGVGLMTINNIGNNTQALWMHYDNTVSQKFIQKKQFVHVSLISLCSFSGRLASGVGSDVIKSKMGMSRYWCLAAAAFVATIAQACALQIENPRHLWAVSSLAGLGYGITFGVFPALVSESFGIDGLSQNWGSMCLAAVLSGNAFNLIYGAVYDHHSSSADQDCLDGLKCYRFAYWVTLVAALLALSVSLWGIRTERLRGAKKNDDHV